MSVTSGPHLALPINTRRTMFLTFLSLSAAAVLLRLPALINAADVNSDAAVVGLQAMHMLRGQWSWFLWGAGYQSSLDSAITAAAFQIFGVSPLVLLIPPLLGHLIVLYLTLRLLSRRIGLGAAAACAMPLVISPWAINSVILSPPRQWCITLLFVAIVLLDGASDSRRPLLRFGTGVMCAMLAAFLDLFAILFAPAIALLALTCIIDHKPDRASVRRRILACAAGLILGSIPLLLARLTPQSNISKAGLSISLVGQNLSLLWQKCLPFSIGYGLYDPGQRLQDRTILTAPTPIYILQFVGGWSLVVGIVGGAVLGFSKRLDWRIRRLGIFGFVAAAATLAAFAVSIMPVDLFAARYLGPIFWTAPFALAPVAAWLGARRFAVAISPYLLVALIGSWLSFGPYVRGPLPRLSDAAIGRDRAGLRQLLLSHDIHYAAGDYWLAYRLTFLWHEDPVVVPLYPWQDRYPPYANAYAKQRRTAWIFHPAISYQPPEPFEQFLQKQQIPYERRQAGRFTVLLIDRGAGKSANPAPPR